jgi:hypothetical protein
MSRPNRMTPTRALALNARLETNHLVLEPLVAAHAPSMFKHRRESGQKTDLDFGELCCQAPLAVHSYAKMPDQPPTDLTFSRKGDRAVEGSSLENPRESPPSEVTTHFPSRNRLRQLRLGAICSR